MPNQTQRRGKQGKRPRSGNVFDWTNDPNQYQLKRMENRMENKHADFNRGLALISLTSRILKITLLQRGKNKCATSAARILNKENVSNRIMLNTHKISLGNKRGRQGRRVKVQENTWDDILLFCVEFIRRRPRSDARKGNSKLLGHSDIALVKFITMIPMDDPFCSSLLVYFLQAIYLLVSKYTQELE